MVNKDILIVIRRRTLLALSLELVAWETRKRDTLENKEKLKSLFLSRGIYPIGRSTIQVQKFNSVICLISYMFAVFRYYLILSMLCCQNRIGMNIL